MDVTISIIIPVGDRSYLARCRECIDASVAAYRGEVWVEVIEVMDEEHRGVDWARNEGLRRATGDWIAWVDCDDEVDTGWFPALAEAITRHQPDVVVLDAVTQNGYDLAYRRNAGDVTPAVFVSDILREVRGGAQCWRMCMKRSLYAGHEFKGQVYEDYGLFLEVCGGIRSVWHLVGHHYCYHVHAGSLARSSGEVGEAAGEWLLALAETVERMPEHMRYAARVGWTLRAADWLLHAKSRYGRDEMKKKIRKELWAVLCDSEVPLKLIVKVLASPL